MKKKIVLPLSVILLVVSLLACQVTSLFPVSTPTSISTATTIPVLPVSSANPNLSDQQDRLMALYQQFSPGVVSIRTPDAQGSGWVYNSDGIIVTNNHVVGSETRVEIDFASGFKTYGDVIGTDAPSDLAVIRVEGAASEMHPLPMGDSETLQVGQIVIAIGNPFGLSGTMTTGIISALGRSLPTSTQVPGGGYFANADLIQTDTALNPGNSGGPLLNLDGQVMGMNSAIETNNYTTNGEPINSGIGFAISINTIKRIVPSLIQDGKFEYAYLGISTRDDLPLVVIEALGLKSTSGAYVTSVLPGGPSDTAGIRAGTQPLNLAGYEGINKGGDLVIAIDGEPVVTFDDMIRYLALHKSPGDSVVLTILRGNERLEITVILGKRP